MIRKSLSKERFSNKKRQTGEPEEETYRRKGFGDSTHPETSPLSANNNNIKFIFIIPFSCIP